MIHCSMHGSCLLLVARGLQYKLGHTFKSIFVSPRASGTAMPPFAAHMRYGEKLVG